MKKVLLFTFFMFLSATSSAEALENSHSLDLESDSQQYLSILDNQDLSITGDMTIELWFKPESLDGPQDFISKWKGPYDLSYGFRYLSDMKVLSFHIASDGFRPYWLGEVEYQLEIGVWYHLALVYDSSEGSAEFYVDGESIGVKTGFPNSIYDGGADFNIGTTQHGSEEWVDGLIDEVRIWSDVRTDNEIRTGMYTAAPPDISNLAGQWSFNNSYTDSVSGVDIESSGTPNFSLDVPFPILEQKYSLYTQIESPYPSEVETASWAGDVYANGFSSCGQTVAQCGCVISSLVMSAQNAGIETDVLGDDVNPGNINEYLKSVGGYTSFGAVNWLAASAYLGEYTSSGKLASRFASAPTRPTSEAVTMSFIDSSLEVGTNAVLAYKRGHFLWLPEKTVDGYVVQDPWWYETETADDVDNNQLYVRDYDNKFTDARVIKIHDEPVEFSGTDIELHLTSATAELLFTNSLGDKVGYSEGSILLDLDNASYGNTEIVSLNGDAANGEAGKHLLVYEAGEEFTVEVVGIESGEFTLEFFTIDEFGEITTFEFSGVTLPGLTTTFTFNLETGEVNESEISYEQFISILSLELDGYTKQQQKFFLKWTDKIFADLDNKTISQALQSIETYKKLLVAKKINSPVLSNLLDLLVEGR